MDESPKNMDESALHNDNTPLLLDERVPPTWMKVHLYNDETSPNKNEGSFHNDNTPLLQDERVKKHG
jgi:hypothetical protein